MAGLPQLAITERQLRELTTQLAGRSLSWLDGGSGALGRFSHLAWGPSELRVTRLGDGDPFASIDDAAPGPFVGDPRALRTIVVIAYDAVWAAPSRFGIRRPMRLARAPSSPVCWTRTHEASLLYDHQTGVASFGGSSIAAIERATADAERALGEPPREASIRVEQVSASDRGRHRERIAQALEAIAAGDLYQVNLARPWDARYDGAPIALAHAMRAASPVPLGAYLEGPDGQTLIARTMERFLAIDGERRIESRPIKGTIDAGQDPAALLGSTKERAEHAMIVDLMRNDLGRVATAGSVSTPVLFEVEPYARLSHLVSHVAATLRDGVTLKDVLWATFPPASISGAPKLSAIEHIEALEEAPRGFYTGALGRIAHDGSVSLAVAIRTAELTATTPNRGTLRYFAGGGIVEASDPDREVEETELKARALLDAIAALT